VVSSERGAERRFDGWPFGSDHGEVSSRKYLVLDSVPRSVGREMSEKATIIEDEAIHVSGKAKSDRDFSAMCEMPEFPPAPFSSEMIAITFRHCFHVRERD
jgi:hypothetical protein